MSDPWRPCKEHEALGGVDSCIACHQRMYEGVPRGWHPDNWKQAERLVRAVAAMLAKGRSVIPVPAMEGMPPGYRPEKDAEYASRLAEVGLASLRGPRP